MCWQSTGRNLSNITVRYCGALSFMGKQLNQKSIASVVSTCPPRLLRSALFHFAASADWHQSGTAANFQSMCHRRFTDTQWSLADASVLG